MLKYICIHIHDSKTDMDMVKSYIQSETNLFAPLSIRVLMEKAVKIPGNMQIMGTTGRSGP